MAMAMVWRGPTTTTTTTTTKRRRARRSCGGARGHRTGAGEGRNCCRINSKRRSFPNRRPVWASETARLSEEAVKSTRRREVLSISAGLGLSLVFSKGGDSARASEQNAVPLDGMEGNDEEVITGQLIVGAGENIRIVGVHFEHKVVEPYSPAIRILPGGSCVLENVTVIHSSPSVASNFAIEVGRDASLLIKGSSVTSNTGSGICVQGGTCEVSSCRIESCKEHGVAAYEDIETGQGSIVMIRDSVIDGCGGYGIQARGEEVQVSVSRSTQISKCKDKYNNFQARILEAD